MVSAHAPTSRAIRRLRPIVLSTTQPQDPWDACRVLGRGAQFRLDEPFSSVDRKTKDSLYPLLREVSAGIPGPTIYVTHHTDDAVNLADSVMTLEAGRLAPAERPWEDE